MFSCVTFAGGFVRVVLQVWDVEKGECVATLEGHENGVAVLGA
mgnify:FL=1